MNINQITENNYLTTCLNCDNGHVWDEKWEDDILIREKIQCPKCKGKGMLFIGSHELNFRLMELNRQIPYLWSMLKHKTEIPQEYYYTDDYDTYTQRCDACDGEGGKQNIVQFTDVNGNLIKEEIKYIVCPKCQGDRYITDFKTIYTNIFNDFVELKEEKRLLLQVIENKKWEQYIGNYEESRPSKSDEVCVRCEKYNDDYKCNGCVNEAQTNANGYSYFTPINDRAKDWYNTKGHTFNLCYDRLHDYTI